MKIACVNLGIGADIDTAEINGIASSPDAVFTAANYGEVQRLTDEIADMICVHCKQRLQLPYRSCFCPIRIYLTTMVLLIPHTGNELVTRKCKDMSNGALF